VKVAIEGQNLLPLEEIGRPPAVNSTLAVGETVEHGRARMEVAGGHEQTDLESRSERLNRGEIDVCEADVGGRQLRRYRVQQSSVDCNAVLAGVPARRLDGGDVTVDCENRLEPELRSGNREHAGTAADVQQAAAIQLVKEAEAKTGRGVRARPEGSPRIDDHGDRGLGRLLPGRPDPERSDPDRPVELAPALLPARLDRL
jgi:hypothetical protein